MTNGKYTNSSHGKILVRLPALFRSWIYVVQDQTRMLLNNLPFLGWQFQFEMLHVAGARSAPYDDNKHIAILPQIEENLIISQMKQM